MSKNYCVSIISPCFIQGINRDKSFVNKYLSSLQEFEDFCNDNNITPSYLGFYFIILLYLNTNKNSALYLKYKLENKLDNMIITEANDILRKGFLKNVDILLNNTSLFRQSNKNITHNVYKDFLQYYMDYVFKLENKNNNNYEYEIVGIKDNTKINCNRFYILSCKQFSDKQKSRPFFQNLYPRIIKISLYDFNIKLKNKDDEIHLITTINCDCNSNNCGNLCYTNCNCIKKKIS